MTSIAFKLWLYIKPTTYITKYFTNIDAHKCKLRRMLYCDYNQATCVVTGLTNSKLCSDLKSK